MRSVREITEEAFHYHQAGDLDRAEQIYDQLLPQLNGNDPNVLYGYASLLAQRGRYGLAVILFRTAISAYDKHAPMWTNLGVAYKHLGMDDLAVAAYEKAAELEPDAPEVLASFSGYWLNRNSGDKAEEYARRGIVAAEKSARDPHALHASHMHLAHALLEQGRFEEAWPHGEHRWETYENKGKQRPYQSPKWDGSRVGTLIIHGEQGLGDEILFMSLFRKAAERVDRVMIECATRLVSIFSDAFEVPCYPDHQSLLAAEGECDAHISMGSLPLILGLPDGKPFLPRKLPMLHSRPRIGIAWRGGTPRTSAKERTLTLKDFAPILAQDADFISVQYGEDIVDEEAAGLMELGPRDFDSLHHRIASCDLIVTVCQTAVHQAGAMDVPCWVLTPRNAAWRYCGESMLPWYDGVSLYRQSVAGDWEEVINRVAGDLARRYARAA